MSISDPAKGFTTRITDLTTHQTGVMVASAGNGFMNTNVNTCAGTPHTFHAEYNTAAQQNQVPWAALEGGVLMQQEIGHFESCNSVKHRFPLSEFGGSFTDNNVFQTCMGGSEGKKAVGEGPCNATTGICQNSSTQGPQVRWPARTQHRGSGQICEFSDGQCFKKGTRTVTINGKARKEHMPVAGCLQEPVPERRPGLRRDVVSAQHLAERDQEPPDGVQVHRAIQCGRASLPADPVRVECTGLGEAVRRHHWRRLPCEAAGL